MERAVLQCRGTIRRRSLIFRSIDSRPFLPPAQNSNSTCHLPAICLPFACHLPTGQVRITSQRPKNERFDTLHITPYTTLYRQEDIHTSDVIAGGDGGGLEVEMERPPLLFS